MNNKFYMLILALFLATSLMPHAAFAHGDEPESHVGEEVGHGHEGEHGEEEHGDKTEISKESADAMKIDVQKAGPATVHQTIGLTGKITLNQNRVAQVRARFPGIVRSVSKGIADEVKKGETLATIESNESLQVYSVVSPLDGVVLGRNTNIGDVAESEPMFVVADLSQLWVEFFIFSRDVERIKPGQKVDIKSLTDETSTEAVLANLLPTAESSSQTVVARVTIDNPDNKWRAGMTVRGDVVLSEREVPLAVKTTAIQRQEGGNVVYVQKGSTYEMRKVDVGQSDREWTEILSGLEPGETYVSANSFIIKADIAKSEAEHEH
jgi:cobalt-zinc-cadmium efflux system membrane fusion protein